MTGRSKEEILSMNENKLKSTYYVSLFCYPGVKDCIRYRNFSIDMKEKQLSSQQCKAGNSFSMCNNYMSQVSSYKLQHHQYVIVIISLLSNLVERKSPQLIS